MRSPSRRELRGAGSVLLTIRPGDGERGRVGPRAGAHNHPGCWGHDPSRTAPAAFRVASGFAPASRPADPIDRIRDQWSRERPELDSSGFGITGRLQVLGKLLERRVARVLEPLDLSLWAFDVLATLRRQGAPYRLTPTELSRATMLTSGAMTNRLDRLEARGLVRREADPDDRRGVRVTLEPAGLELVDRAIALRFEESLEAVGTLASGDRRTLEELLREVLLALEREREADDAGTG